MGLLDCVRTCCKNFNANARQLWRRLMLKLLINNVDARLHKIGFLYSGRDHWQLAPAINLTPSVKPRQPSTTSRIAEQGPMCDVDKLLGLSAAFELPQVEAPCVLANMVDVVGRWRTEVSQFAVSMKPAEMGLLEGAMNNQHFRQAQRWSIPTVQSPEQGELDLSSVNVLDEPSSGQGVRI